MQVPSLQSLAYPGVVSLVAFLALSSQYLFNYIEPGPLRTGDAYIFNALVAALLVCYTRTCFTDPGRIPCNWYEQYAANGDGVIDANVPQRQRWCRRCDALKPLRAHHCKTCKRCIMKMDHHCVWTANCVSHITLPHFVRFLIYAVAAMVYLEALFYARCAVIWSNRKLPSYLGPSPLQLAHIFILVVTNSMVLFALILLLGRTVWSLALNMTTIEGWEIERHQALLRRARVLGGYLDGPDGKKIRIEPQEFPWDIGIWANICQGMGSRNSFAWLWPFARSPSINNGFMFEHNGIDDPSKPWPPPDPDRMFRAPRAFLSGNGFTQPFGIEEFRKRQEADRGRYDADGDLVVRRRPFHERYQNQAERVYDVDEHENAIETDDEEPELVGSGDGTIACDEGEEAWRNKEGERLADFGLDEDAEFYDEDELPLAELVRSRILSSKD